MKKRVTGLGGVFFKARDPEATKARYNEHLHLDAGEYGAMFKWRDFLHHEREGNKIELWEPADEGTF